MKNSSSRGLAILLFFTLTVSANAQVIAIEGSHDLSGSVRHRDFDRPPGDPIWINSFDQIVPVTTIGPSTHSGSVDDNVFEANLTLQSEWTSNSESVIGSLTKTGDINFPGWIGNNLDPEYLSNAIVDFTVDLDTAGTPFRLTIEWDMLPYIATGDGWGYSSFIVAVGDRGTYGYYDLVAGGSMDNIAPNSGPNGTVIVEGISRFANLRVNINLYGPGDSQGIGGCSGMFCGWGTVAQESFVNYELLVGDAALPADTDNDGIPDGVDNCTQVANTDQYDSNGDGYGNLCDPDLDNNNVVNFIDFSILTAAFLATPMSPGWNPDADLDNNGVVNFIDVSIFPAFFLGPPGPSANEFN